MGVLCQLWSEPVPDNMGPHYMRPHEHGRIEALFRDDLSQIVGALALIVLSDPQGSVIVELDIWPVIY